MTPDYAVILGRKYPGKQWILNGDAYEGLTWVSDGTPPSQAELDVLWPTVQNEIATEKADKEAMRASALAKLGLTADEVAALFG